MITIIGVGSFLGLWSLFLWLEWLKPKLERRKALGELNKRMLEL